MTKAIELKPCPTVELDAIRFETHIPPGAKILFAELTAWSKQYNGFCPYQPKSLAKIYQVSEFTIRKWINCLVEMGFIKMIVDFNGSRRQTKVIICEHM